MKHKNRIGQFAGKVAPSLLQRDFRWYLTGLFISGTGIWNQSFTLSWVGMQLSPSPFWQGFLVFAQYIPMTLLTLPAGAIADRVRKRSLLLITQLSMAALALFLGIAFLFNLQSYILLLSVSIVYGTLMAFNLPVRDSFIGEVAGEDHLRNAIGFFSVTVNITKMTGPVLAGYMMSLLGNHWCFFISAVSFIPMILIIWKGPGGREIANREKEGLWREIASGLLFIRNNRLMLRACILAMIIVTLVANYNVLVPLTARDSLHLGEAGGGILMVYIGLGSATGGIILAALHRLSHKRGVFESLSIAAPAATLFIGFHENYILSALLLFITGFTFISFANLTVTILQTNTEMKYRGRIMSIFSLIMGGSVPIGSLIAGGLANGHSVWFVWFWCAIICLGTISLVYLMFFLARIRTLSRYRNKQETDQFTEPRRHG